MSTPELSFILEKTGDGHSTLDFTLFACRGAGRGCKRNKYRQMKIHCPDCVEANPTETLAKLKSRLARGDA